MKIILQEDSRPILGETHELYYGTDGWWTTNIKSAKIFNNYAEVSVFKKWCKENQEHRLLENSKFVEKEDHFFF